jgi:hypothetical protein
VLDARAVSETPADSVPSHVVASVVNGCRQALSDYQAGLTDDVELTRALRWAGLAVAPDRVRLFDRSSGRWWELDGIAADQASGINRPAHTARLRQVVDDLAADVREHAPLAEAGDVHLLVTKEDRG